MVAETRLTGAIPAENPEPCPPGTLGLSKASEVKKKTPGPLAAMALALAGYLVGESILLWDAFHGESGRFIARPETIVWLGLIGFQTASWALFVIPLWATMTHLLHDLKDKSPRTWASMIGTVLLFAFLVIVPFVVGKTIQSATDVSLGWLKSPLQGQESKTLLLTLLGGLVALPGIASIWLIHAILGQLVEEPTRPEEASSDRIQRLLDLKSDLQKILWILGAMVGLVTLSAGALRNALLAWDSDLVFPAEAVLAYGAQFTILLALSYVPTHLRWQGVGTALREQQFPIVGPEDKCFEVVQQRRGNWDELLELQGGPFANMKATVAILTPLASSLVSVLLTG